MAASSSSRNREPRAAAVADVAEGSTSTRSRLDAVSQAILAPFTHRKTDSNKLLSDRTSCAPLRTHARPDLSCSPPVAPAIMTPKMINAAANASKQRGAIRGSSNHSHARMDFAALGRAPLRLTMGSRRLTSHDLQIVEATDELLHEEVPEPEGVASDVSLLRGFNATIPSSEKGKARRRQTRNVDTPKLGLKRLGMSARGMLADDDESVASEDDVVLVGRSEGTGKKSKAKRKGRQSLAAQVNFGKDELLRQTQEIERDKENLHVRRVSYSYASRTCMCAQTHQALINNEIAEISHKIEALDAIRIRLEQDLLRLQEDELELEDECENIVLFRYSRAHCRGSGGRDREARVRRVQFAGIQGSTTTDSLDFQETERSEYRSSG